MPPCSVPCSRARQRRRASQCRSTCTWCCFLRHGERQYRCGTANHRNERAPSNGNGQHTIRWFAGFNSRSPWRRRAQLLYFGMTTAENIEKAVEQLAPRELARFRAWFEAFDAEQFDTAIERDARAGKLDARRTQ